MMQLLLKITRVGEGATTVKILKYDAVAAGRAFERGPLGHALAVSALTMTTHYACDGWGDVWEFLKGEIAFTKGT
jgi:hypothetical protein